MRRESLGVAETAPPVNPLRSCTDGTDAEIHHAACDRLTCPRHGPPLLPVLRLRAVQTVTFRSARAGDAGCRRDRYRADETAQGADSSDGALVTEQRTDSRGKAPLPVFAPRSAFCR